MKCNKRADNMYVLCPDRTLIGGPDAIGKNTDVIVWSNSFRWSQQRRPESTIVQFRIENDPVPFS